MAEFSIRFLFQNAYHKQTSSAKRSTTIFNPFMSDDHSPLPTFPSIRHCYINLFPFQSVFGSDLHKHKIVCFLKESNMDQNFYQGVLRILIAKMFELI